MSNISITGTKVQWDAGGGRIMLGDNTGGGAVMPRSIRFHCVGLWISTGIPLHMHVQLTVCILNSTWHRPSVTLTTA